MAFSKAVVGGGKGVVVEEGNTMGQADLNVCESSQWTGCGI